jgi:serine/threonine-protein phosphatase 2A regulatory subunit B'
MARADVAIPKGQRERRRNSNSSGKEVVLQELAPLRDTPSTKREELFKKKLELCTICFDFEDAAADKRGKETKRSTLLELVDYVNAQSGQKIFTEALMPDIMTMVKANICRALPPNNEDFDPEEDEPILENSWPHLQVRSEKKEKKRKEKKRDLYHIGRGTRGATENNLNIIS